MGQKISLAESSARSGLSVKTLRRKIASQELRAFRVGDGRTIRVDVDDLEALFQPIGGGGASC